MEKITNLIMKSILLNRWPLQVSLYYSKKAKELLDLDDDFLFSITIALMFNILEI